MNFPLNELHISNPQKEATQLIFEFLFWTSRRTSVMVRPAFKFVFELLKVPPRRLFPRLFSSNDSFRSKVANFTEKYEKTQQKNLSLCIKTLFFWTQFSHSLLCLFKTDTKNKPFASCAKVLTLASSVLVRSAEIHWWKDWKQQFYLKKFISF